MKKNKPSKKRKNKIKRYKRNHYKKIIIKKSTNAYTHASTRASYMYAFIHICYLLYNTFQ